MPSRTPQPRLPPPSTLTGPSVLTLRVAWCGWVVSALVVLGQCGCSFTPEVAFGLLGGLAWDVEAVAQCVGDVPCFLQCRTVKISILGDEGVPVQVDGEAWIQPPGYIRIIHKNRAQTLTRDRVRMG